MPWLQPVFDRLAGPDEWIELDKLDINIGHLGPDEPDQVWLDKTFRAYTTALEKQLGKSDTQRKTPAAQTSDLLGLFLAHGTLPWTVDGGRETVDEKRWTRDGGRETVDERRTSDSKRRIKRMVLEQLPALSKRLPQLLADPTSRKRWVQQFDDALQTEALNVVMPSAVPLEQVLSLSVWLDLFPAALRRRLRNLYWETLWEVLFRPENWIENWLPKLFSKSLAMLSDIEDLEQVLKICFVFGHYAALPEKAKKHSLDALAEALVLRVHRLQIVEKKQFIKKIRQMLQNRAHGFLAEKARLLKVLEQKMPQFPESSKLSGNSVSPPRPPDTARISKKTPRQTDLEPEGIFVPLAGIVLTHPFLPAFFERLGLLNGEGQFHDEATQERAIHLLYYLATGLQHPAEEELALLKILCGIDLETPVERELDLTEIEKTETLNLLSALISRWEALEGSTPDDLRGSFFTRDGKLRRGELGLYLTVETKTWDILMAKLPWGLSPLMHTWMREMLWVDWA